MHQNVVSAFGAAEQDIQKEKEIGSQKNTLGVMVAWERLKNNEQNIFIREKIFIQNFPF